MPFLARGEEVAVGAAPTSKFSSLPSADGPIKDLFSCRIPFPTPESHELLRESW